MMSFETLNLLAAPPPEEQLHTTTDFSIATESHLPSFSRRRVFPCHKSIKMKLSIAASLLCLSATAYGFAPQATLAR
jgi:hypothetical protein